MRVGADEGVELWGESEGDEEVVPWQLPLHLCSYPHMSFVVLAGGAVAIAAGTEEEMDLTAALALIEGGSTSLSTTVDDGVDDFDVVVRHRILILPDILWSVGSKDIVDGCHFRVPP